MPEINNSFHKAKMNKDLDERLVQGGEYRHAMNVQINNSDGADIGTVQNILGNSRIGSIVGSSAVCVGTISDDKNDCLYWFAKTNNIEYILKLSIRQGIVTPVFVDTKANTSNAVLKFPSKIITGINIIDNLLFWTDGENEPRKINIDRCIEGTNINGTTHTQLVTLGVSHGDIEEENITVIRKRPLTAPLIKINKYTEEEEDEEDFNPDYLFEKKFVRFSTRYKYADGEYSSFGPFSNVVFDAGEFDLPIDEPYNAGMQNRIKSVEIKDFVHVDIPKDVVQIDILYKEDDSNVVYSVTSIKSTDAEWSATSPDVVSNSLIIGFSGVYILDNENIYAAVPEDQMIRSWDNVPKKAIAQEITGNRIVYGNYTQGYDLLQDQYPMLEVGYKERAINDVAGLFVEGGLPSIKSQRNYQLGVVYGDKYGRETPIFTSSKSAVKVPWSDDFGENASRSNLLTATLKQPNIPVWADYYKIYVKETSEKYHNLLMDRVYLNILEDKSVEDTIWISFPSSDRNKLTEDDYIIMKKTYGTDGHQVSQKNSFKVLDISNQAPDAIRYKYVSVGEEANGSTNSATNLFVTNFNPIPGQRWLRIKSQEWKDANGANLDTESLNGDFIYASFEALTGTASQAKKSQKYRISSATLDGGEITLRLDNPIAESDSWCVVGGGTNTIPTTSGFNFTFKIERRVLRGLEQFSGRFFVKIASNEITRKEIEPYLETRINPGLVNTGEILPLRYVEDKTNASGTHNNTAINNWNGLGKGYDDDSNDNITETLRDDASDWTNSNVYKKWFIDSAFFKSVQHKDRLHCNFSGRGTHGGNLTDGPSTSIAGDNMINGLEGIIEVNPTGGIHASRIYTDGVGEPNYGLRRWQQIPVNGDNESSSYRKLDNTYKNTANIRYYMHLSFSGCGEDLHNGNSHFSRADIPTDGSKLRNYSKATKRFALKNGLGNISVRGRNWKHNGRSIQMVNNDTVHPIDSNIRDKQWEPQMDDKINQQIVNNLKKGAQFVFRDDPNRNIYTIKNHPVVKRLYNHTSWNKTYEYKNNQIQSTGDSVEDAARAWADDLGGAFWQTPNQGNTSKALALMNKIVEFGKADNRRICYIIELDKNPCSSSWDPTEIDTSDGKVGLDIATEGVIDFVKQDVDVLGNLTKSTPAVFETEPKDGVDLNLYYEASRAIPLQLTDINNEAFGKPGSFIRLHTPSENEDWGMEDVTKFTGNEYPIITKWTSSDTFEVEGLYANYPTFENGAFKQRWIGDGYGFPIPNTGNTYYVADGVGADPYKLFIDIYDEEKGFVRAKVVSYQMALPSFSKNFTPGNKLGMATLTNINKITIEKINSDLPVGIGWYNCIAFGNGIESNSIRDDFSSMSLSDGVRASTTIEQPYEEENRKSGLIYSGIYNSTSGINNLNQFIMGEKITKDLNPTYGSIQKLFSRRVSLVAFCEDRVVGITANKSALYNADGNPQLVASDAVLGDANPFIGDYGIGKNPESFSKESYRAYFTDKQRGAVLRLSMDGITPISDYGMQDFFKDNLKTYPNLIGTYDEYKKDYNLTLTDYFLENLFVNESVSEGTFFRDQTDKVELLMEGSFQDGIPFTAGTPVPNNPKNRGFRQEVLITNIDAVPGVAGVTASPASTINATYTVSSRAMQFTTHPELGGNVNSGAAYSPFETALGTPPIKWKAYAQGQFGDYYTGGSTSTDWWNGRHEEGVLSINCDSNDYVEPETDTLPDTNLHAAVKTYFNTIGEYPINSTIFNGEEVTVYFYMALRNSSDAFSPKVKIFDAGTGALVNNSLIHSISSGNAGMDWSSFNTGFSNTDPSYVGYQPNDIDGYKTGYNDTNTFSWGTAGRIGDGQTYTAKGFRVGFKFLDPNDIDNANKVIVQKLIFQISNADTDNDDFAIKSFRFNRQRSLNQPKVLMGEYNYAANGGTLDPVTGWPGIAAIPATAATVEFTNGVNASPSYKIDSWSKTGTTELFNDIQALYNSNTVSYWDQISNQAADQYADGWYETTSSGGKITKPSGSAGTFSQDLTTSEDSEFSSFDGSGPFVDGEWYEITLTYESGTYSGTPPVVLNVMDIVDENAFYGEEWDGAGNPMKGYSLGTPNGTGSLALIDIGGNKLRCIFKMADISNRPANADNDVLQIWIGGGTGITIETIEINNLSDTGSGWSNTHPKGNAGGWTLVGDEMMSKRNSNFNPPLYFHRTSSNRDGIQFKDVPYVYPNGYRATWYFYELVAGKPFGFNNGIDILPPTDAGYEFSFDVKKGASSSVTGELKMYMGLKEGTSPVYGFKLDGINAEGTYRVPVNFYNNNPSANGGTGTFTTPNGTESSFSSIGLPTNTPTGWYNKLNFSVESGSANVNMHISKMSLIEQTNVFYGGDISGWNFSGFDSALYNFAIFNDDNLTLQLTEAPYNVSVYQGIKEMFNNGDTVRIKFDIINYTGTGTVRLYYFNENGNGFLEEGISGNQTFDKQFTIGSETVTSFDTGGTYALGNTTSYNFTSTTGVPRNTFVIEVENNAGQPTFSAELDNFVLNREFNLTSQTISYNEDVKGWTSFKSFVPENGLSASSSYYTFKDGRLYLHHDLNSTRNTFYNDNFVNSTITTLLNASPSDVKIFNTLAYEGSQSKINSFSTDYDSSGDIISTASDYNLTDKNGWFVSSIVTDKQVGSVKEFIEKEGKWFNYIKGSPTGIDPAAFNFQGVGIVSGHTVVSELPENLNQTQSSSSQSSNNNTANQSNY